MENSKNTRFYILATLAVSIIVLGTVVYHYLEGLEWVDAFYFSVITLTTVGYGDITPLTTLGKLFTTIYILVGIGIIVAFISATADRMITKRVQQHEQKIGNANKS